MDLEQRTMRILAALFCAFFLVATNAVAAEGELSATSYKGIPKAATISIRPWDNSDDNLKLAREIKAALEADGHSVRDEADFVLSFSTRNRLGDWSPGGRRSVLELKGSSGRGDVETARVQLNLYSSDQGGVLNRGEEPGSVVPTNYQLEVTVDGPNGVRYWQGEATANLERSDGLSLTRSMVPNLIRTLGQTVPIQSFEIR